ncbi:MAG: hypothetical protein ACT4QF_20500 [Sporichthyaceae bacterium]
MATTTAAPRFDVAEISLAVAGPQTFALDAHITTRGTRRGQNARDVLTVSLGSLLVYCHDLESVQAFATAWHRTAELAAHLPATATATVPADRNHVGIVLRVAGTPARWAYNLIPAKADPAGIAHARVQIGHLTVRAYDRAAVGSWTEAWDQTLTTAHRLWPAPDHRAARKLRERNRIARTGTLATPLRLAALTR